MTNEQFNEKLAKIFKDEDECLGRTWEFSDDLRAEIGKTGLVDNVHEMLKEEHIRVYSHGGIDSRGLVFYVLQGMLERGEIGLQFTNKAKQKDIEYLNSLVMRY